MIGKTNVGAYFSKKEVGNDVSISYSRVPINFSGKITNIIKHGDIMIVQPEKSTYIFVSEDGGNIFISVTLGFCVTDIIYSEIYSRFIAVGYTTNAIYTVDALPFIAISDDAVTWHICEKIVEDNNDINVECNMILGVLENNGVLYGMYICEHVSDINTTYSYICNICSKQIEISNDNIEKIQHVSSKEIGAYRTSGTLTNRIALLKTGFGVVMRYDNEASSGESARHTHFISLDGIVIDNPKDGSENYTLTYGGSFLVMLQGTTVRISYDGNNFYEAATNVTKEISFIFKYNDLYYGILDTNIYCGKTIAEMVESEPMASFDYSDITYGTVIDGQIYVAGSGSLYKLFINSDYQPETLMLTLDAAKSAYARTIEVKKQVEAMIGTTDISMIGDGTLTGAVKAIYDSQNNIM